MCVFWYSTPTLLSRGHLAHCDDQAKEVEGNLGFYKTLETSVNNSMHCKLNACCCQTPV